MSSPLYSISIIVSLLLVACKGSDKPVSDPLPETPAITTYPLPPEGLLDSLQPFVTTIDYLFNNLPISMSVTERNAIWTMFSHISGKEPVPLQHGCKPIGRIFYVASGETALTGSLYFGKDCKFVVFLENEEPVFAVQLTQHGITFLQNAGVPLL